MRVRQLARAGDDGYRSGLAPGLKASSDARRLAEEVAFSAGRLRLLASDPPGLYAEAVMADDREEGLWIAFLIAYLGPLEGDGEPFAAIEAVRVPWAGGALPDLDGVELGPRSGHEPARGAATLAAYRSWAERSGSQAAGLAGEPSWSPRRRAERLAERLALPGLGHGARHELLLSLGALGLIEVEPGSPRLDRPGDEVAIAAKRVFGIGDPLLLQRRTAELAEAAGAPVAALDLALFNWGRHGNLEASRATYATPPGAADTAVHDRLAAALGL